MYSARTGHLPPTPTCVAFADAFARGAHILEVGCGSGRDAAYFLSKGLVVTAFDGSTAMVEQARARTEGLVSCTTWDMTQHHWPWQGQMDGIWASASLLHLPRAEMFPVWQSMQKALSPEGPGRVCITLKQGQGEGYDAEGRFFTYYDPAQLLELAQRSGLFATCEVRASTLDQLGRANTEWLELHGMMFPLALQNAPGYG